MQITTYIIDFDSTIINCESMDILAQHVLADNPLKNEIQKEIEKITDQ